MGTNPTEGDKMRIWRKAQGLSQAQLAIRIGSTRGSIANYETGRAQIPFEVRLALNDFDPESAKQSSDFVNIRVKRSQLRLLLQIIRNDQVPQPIRDDAYEELRSILDLTPADQ